MTERASWKCGGCDGWHGPHVDTCPNQEARLSRAAYLGEWPEHLRPVPDFSMTPVNTRIVAGDHASPKPRPDRYRRLMGDIDA